MKRRYKKLSAVAELRQVSVETLVREAVEQTGSLLGAARELDVSPNTIRYWMNRMGLHVETRQVAVLTPINDEVLS